MRNDDKDLEKPKFYLYSISFNNLQDREDFKNKILSLKLKTGLSIGKICTQMLSDFIKARKS